MVRQQSEFPIAKCVYEGQDDARRLVSIEIVIMRPELGHRMAQVIDRYLAGCPAQFSNGGEEYEGMSICFIHHIDELIESLFAEDRLHADEELNIAQLVAAAKEKREPLTGKHADWYQWLDWYFTDYTCLVPYEEWKRAVNKNMFQVNRNEPPASQNGGGSRKPPLHRRSAPSISS